MSNKKLVILFVVAVFMVIWAIVQSRISNRQVNTTGEPTYLVQGLDTTDIDSIVIGKGEDEVTLKRLGAGFVVVDKENYPAKVSQINDLISKCLEIERTQFVTDKIENHEDLEVTEEKARTVVKFLKPDSTMLAGIIIGKNRDLGQGSYVRLASDDKVYVAQDVPWFSSGAMNFIEQQLTSIKRDDIASVTVSSPDGSYILKAKGNGTEIEMENVPADKQFKSTEAQGVFNVLTNLSFSDVMREPNDMSFDSQFVGRLNDSTEYTINIAMKDDKTFMSCSARFTEERPTTIRKDESEEELKEKEAKLLADDNAKEFTAKHKGWVYEVPDYKANNLKVKLSDLLEDRRESEMDNPADPNAMTFGESVIP
jgi:hypothetical protein